MLQWAHSSAVGTTDAAHSAAAPDLSPLRSYCADRYREGGEEPGVTPVCLQVIASSFFRRDHVVNGCCQWPFTVISDAPGPVTDTPVCAPAILGERHSRPSLSYRATL